jgi:hypothetical protein
MLICTRCAALYGSSPVDGLCSRCISIPNPPEIPIVKDEEWNLAEAKASQYFCTILGRIPKLSWYKIAQPKEVGGYRFAINQGDHQYLLRRKFWSELTPEEQKRVETVDSLSALRTRSDFRARREAEEKQKSQQ